MARATFVKKARKNVKGTDIKKGESYYWWKFQRGGKQYSRTRPRPSQLTMSDFYSRLYSIQEQMEDATSGDDIESLIDDIKSQLEELRDEQEEKRSNMPDSLQESPTGELLQERYDAIDEMISELDNIDYTNDEDVDTEAFDERQQEILDELQQISCSV